MNTQNIKYIEFNEKCVDTNRDNNDLFEIPLNYTKNKDEFLNNNLKESLLNDVKLDKIEKENKNCLKIEKGDNTKNNEISKNLNNNPIKSNNTNDFKSTNQVKYL